MTHRVLYPPTVNWNLLFQRPNQILRVLAKNGHDSFFMNLPLRTKGALVTDKMLEVEKNLFITPMTIKMMDIKPDVFYFNLPNYNMSPAWRTPTTPASS